MIKPLNNKIQIELEKVKVGSLDMSSSKTATEVGTIKALGENVDKSKFKVGDKILFKAWQTDVITYNGEDYYFLDSDGQGICALVK